MFEAFVMTGKFFDKRMAVNLFVGPEKIEKPRTMRTIRRGSRFFSIFLSQFQNPAEKIVGVSALKMNWWMGMALF